MIEMMMRAAQLVQLRVIARSARLVDRLFDLAHLRLDHHLLGVDRAVMIVRVDAERPADRGQQAPLFR